ncbi:MAG: lipoyl(octanoyl) transferase LipB [Gammaproteobacteria bacterium]|nr:lipoyl(octanoyl) transferase LipB [Gammaproteobacteria bacterium]MDH3465286.1 lipoyl(octanoyl) transferase LipB [Gammaproteobacteria bacterium]
MPVSSASSIVVRRLGRVDYLSILNRMRDFTESRTASSDDEIWLLQHLPVYTQGISCQARPRAAGEAIPVVAADRGGQMTYHGPGQLVVYVLLDLKRRGLGVRRLVAVLEQAVIDLLAQYGLHGARREGAPGVYVANAKVAALGIRVRRGASYHGLSLNVAMDLSPFLAIDPCGFEGLAVTDLRSLGVDIDLDVVAAQLVSILVSELDCDSVEFL